MSKVEFKLDTKNFGRQVLKAEWMRSSMEEYAKKEAKSGDTVSPYYGFDRAKAFIRSGNGGKND